MAKETTSSAGSTPAASTTSTPTTGTRPKRERKRMKVESTMAKIWKADKVGDVLEGTYLGMEMVKGKGKRGMFRSYHIEKEDGERVRLASAMLNTKMNQVPKGTYIWLTFKGDFETDNGPSPDYEVEVEDGTELTDPLQETGSVQEATV